MSEPTAGDLARFLEANPGPHRIGGYIAQHVATIPSEVWRDIQQDQRQEKP